MSNSTWGIAGAGAVAAAVLAWIFLTPEEVPQGEAARELPPVEEPVTTGMAEGERAPANQPAEDDVAERAPEPRDTPADTAEDTVSTQEAAPDETAATQGAALDETAATQGAALDETAATQEAAGGETVRSEDATPQETAETELAAPADDIVQTDEPTPPLTEESETPPLTAESDVADAPVIEAPAAVETATVTEAPEVEAAPATPVEETTSPQDVAEADLPPAPETVVETDAAAEPEPAEAAAQDVATAPTFDLVRIERDGSAIIAGRAEPETEVEIVADGEVIGTAVAGRTGEFVAMLETPTGAEPRSLTLESVSEFGEVAVSEETLIVIVPEAEEAAAQAEPPTVVLSTPRAVEVIQPTVAPADGIVLDTITYSEEGEVVLTGRGDPGSAAFIYADDRPIVQADIRQDGNWTAVVNTLDAGIYTLRVDEVAEDGDVTSRIESPFQREDPEVVEESQSDTAPELQVTVQPGNNLWTIARERYGEGPLFTVIFEANAAQIRDPDLIYPGQIFDLPE